MVPRKRTGLHPSSNAQAPAVPVSIGSAWTVHGRWIVMRTQPVEPASLRVTTVATAPLDAVIAGSVQAFGEVFDAHAVEVLAFCRRRCLDVNDAEDLMSVV